MWSHATVFPSRPSEVIAAGVEVVSHCADLVWETAERVPDTYREGRDMQVEMSTDGWVLSDASERVFAQMLERGTILDATLYVFTRIAKRPGEEAPLFATAVEYTRRAHAPNG